MSLFIFTMLGVTKKFHTASVRIILQPIGCIKRHFAGWFATKFLQAGYYLKILPPLKFNSSINRRLTAIATNYGIFIPAAHPSLKKPRV